MDKQDLLDDIKKVRNEISRKTPYLSHENNISSMNKRSEVDMLIQRLSDLNQQYHNLFGELPPE